MTKARDNYGKALTFIEDALTQDTDECIRWPFGLVAGRYPNIGHGQRVNRVICERKHGAPPAGHEAAHSCGNAICVNWKHLRWAMHIDNMADAIAHGTIQRGEQVPTAKLTIADVIAIRASTRTPKELASQFGVTQTQIYFILKRKSWKHV